ncbi:hypothetical protein SAMN05444372_107148 [Flavobacterium micromati]|jgi:hypothetical protein|uniref:Lipoprotein NlpD n=1 Tax=Flavobacterium micromati TaxID=229205 RepID=A0A1M5L010_9FLAO|nr:peptidase [Flavobacterium micromati]MCL6461540.1 peptidase [Flavobacterium micromati]SHG58099.1 hypothetical protein SAMN05444372_107148 [Flavobacterium micromati]
MLKTKLKKLKIKENLFNKRRLIILNEDTFEETFSLKLTLMNVFVFATLGAIIITFVTTFIIAFTTLREFIPGYSSTKLKKDATELALKSDSLTIALKKNEVYILSIKKVLTGKLDYAKFNKDSIIAATELTIKPEKLKASEEELELRDQILEEEKNVQLNKAFTPEEGNSKKSKK